jgi:hypothetical protein
MTALPARLRRYVHTITKEQCRHDIPPCDVTVDLVPMSAEQRFFYDRFLDPSVIQGNNAWRRAARQVGHLRDICAAPASCRFPGATRVLSNHTPKITRILELLNAEPEEQFVIVSARIEQTNEIERWLHNCAITTARIDSTVNDPTWQANYFKSGRPRVMLMGAKCAAAHSFPQCARLIVASLEWAPGVLAQTIGRIHRINSQRPCRVWILLHERSIEVVQLEVNREKDRLIKLALLGEPVKIPNVLAREILLSAVKQWRDN